MRSFTSKYSRILLVVMSVITSLCVGIFTAPQAATAAQPKTVVMPHSQNVTVTWNAKCVESGTSQATVIIYFTSHVSCGKMPIYPGFLC